MGTHDDLIDKAEIAELFGIKVASVDAILHHSRPGGRHYGRDAFPQPVPGQQRERVVPHFGGSTRTVYVPLWERSAVLSWAARTGRMVIIRKAVVS